MVSAAALTATAIAVTIPVAILCLVLMNSDSPGFGTANDLGNGLVGVLSAVLAAQTARFGTPVAAVAAAGAGGAVMVVGSWLVITGRTGWVLAGLVSSVGAALVGVWLVAANRAASHTGSLPRPLATSGVVAGALMGAGLLTVTGIVAGADAWASLSWLDQAGLLGWFGLYLGYPVWCGLLARHLFCQRRTG
jgi:hypothetical protein